MWLRLRQICLVTDRLEAVAAELEAIFGIEVCYIDPAVEKYGLNNRLFPIGNQFLELVAPVRPGTAAGRYLAKRGGDGGYMVITQCDSLEPRRQRLAELGIRIANELNHEGFQGIQLHPKDTGAAFFEMDCQAGGDAPDGPWHPAGPRWRDHVRLHVVTGIDAFELQSPDPGALGQRWADAAQLGLDARENGYQMQLENAAVRFMPTADASGEGLSAIVLRASDPERAFETAQTMGAVDSDGHILVCGTRFKLSG